MGPERQQDIHFQFTRRRRDRHFRHDGQVQGNQGDQRVSGAGGRTGPQDRQAPGQDGHPRVPHGRSLHAGLPHSEGKPPGAGRPGVQDRHDDPGRRPDRHCRAGPGHRTGALDESVRYSRNGSSSENPSPTFRPSSGCSRTWRRKSRRRGSSPTMPPGAATRVNLSARKRPWRSFRIETAARQTNRAVQVHGGIGYIKGTKVERLYRDAKITEIYEGTSEVMRMVISGSLLR